MSLQTDASRDTSCGTAYEYCCSPVADGYRLSDSRCDDTLAWHGWHNHTPNYGTVYACIEGTAPSGGWIRRQCKREIEHRRAGQRRVELTLREIFFFSDQYRNYEDRFVFWYGGDGEPTGRERKPEHVQGSGDRVG